MTPELKKELYGLLNDMCEGALEEGQRLRLDAILKSDRQACEIYIDFTSIWSDLRYLQTSLYSQNDRCSNILEIMKNPNGLSDSAIWRALALDEKEAPSIEIPHKKQSRQLVQKVVYEKKHHKINKFSLFTAISSAAAIILIVLASRLLPSYSSEPVASITSSVNAYWSDSNEIYKTGKRLWNDGSWHYLTRGMTEITFDSGARVLLESPSQFRILNENEMSFQGILTAEVPDSAYGFTIHTKHSKVTDLGTQFGLISTETNETEVHVLKGKVQVAEAVSARNNPSAQLVETGQGCRVSSSGTISRIEYNANRFYWDMPSAYEYVVMKTNPLYYLRFDRGQEEILRNEITSQSQPNSLIGTLHFNEGPPINGNRDSQALHFSGNKESYLVFDDNPEDYQNATGFSISLWIRPEVSKAQDIFVHRKKDARSIHTDEIILTEDNCVRFYVFCPPDAPQPWAYDLRVKGYNKIKSNPISLNQWTHIVAAYTNEGMMNLYINGQLEASKKLTSKVEVYPEVDCWYIGSQWQDFENELQTVPGNFIGSIDEISRYNRELIAEEVKMLYESASK